MKTEKRNFAYDDAFRTMTVECDDLVLPLLNHMFGESYDAQARVSRLGNESFLRDPEGGEHRRITDSRIEVESRSLSAFSKDVIIMLIEHVIRKLAENHESIQKKVGDLMGGQVLDLDIIRIKHEAEAIGEKKGRAEGRAEGKVEEKENGIRILIQDNLEEGKSEEVILEKLMRRYDLKESEARQYFERFLKPE